MEANIPCRSKNIYSQVPNQPPLRAIIEIDGGRLRVIPIAGSDEDERRILDTLRSVVKERRQ
jgi:hypothetical protein